MSSAAVPHPDYLITLVGPGSGAGAGVPGAAVRDAATGRVIDRVPGRKEMYSAVAGTASNRLFFLATRSSGERAAGRDPDAGRERAAGRDPDAGQTPPGGAFRLELNDDGTVADLSAVPGITESGPDGYGITDLAGTADASKLMLTSRRRPRGAPAPGAPPAEIHIVTVATGRRVTWRAGSSGQVRYLSSSADGQRMAFIQDGAGSSGVQVIDLPGTGPLAIDAASQHALIAYSGNVARIDLTSGQLTELPIEENGAFDAAW
jgi:hypothetical protein